MSEELESLAEAGAARLQDGVLPDNGDHDWTFRLVLSAMFGAAALASAVALLHSSNPEAVDEVTAQLERLGLDARRDKA